MSDEDVEMKEERKTDNKDIIEINDNKKEVIEKVLETEINKVESTLVRETLEKISPDPVDTEKSKGTQDEVRHQAEMDKPSEITKESDAEHKAIVYMHIR